MTETGFSVAGPKALKQAGLTPKDIQLFTPYDDFLIAILIQLEQIGFCGRGEGSDFILRTDMTYKGTLPLNTSGGQISARQPGPAGGCPHPVRSRRRLFRAGRARRIVDVNTVLPTPPHA